MHNFNDYSHNFNDLGIFLTIALNFNVYPIILTIWLRKKSRRNLKNRILTIFSVQNPAFWYYYAKKTVILILFLYQNYRPIVVEATGFEPTTFASRTQRATNCATPRRFLRNANIITNTCVIVNPFLVGLSNLFKKLFFFSSFSFLIPV